jgi:hypothetical protein
MPLSTTCDSHTKPLTGSINQIERPFTPDSGRDFGNIWTSRQDQIIPVTKRLAKPNALMFFHIPLYGAMFSSPFLLLTVIISPESYSRADKASGTDKLLDIGISGQETPGSAKHNGGFFEKAILKAPESDHTAKGNALEVKVIGNGHCHGILFIHLNILAANALQLLSDRKL